MRRVSAYHLTSLPSRSQRAAVKMMIDLRMVTAISDQAPFSNDLMFQFPKYVHLYSMRTYTGTHMGPHFLSAVDALGLRFLEVTFPR